MRVCARTRVCVKGELIQQVIMFVAYAGDLLTLDQFLHFLTVLGEKVNQS